MSGPLPRQSTLGDYLRSQSKLRCPAHWCAKHCELKTGHLGYHEAAMGGGLEGRAYWTPHVRRPLHPEYCRCAKWCAEQTQQGGNT